MKNKHWMVLLSMLVSLAMPVRPADDKALDALPIGVSSHRLELAVLPAGKVMDTASGQEVDLPALVRQNLNRDQISVQRITDNFQRLVDRIDAAEGNNGFASSQRDTCDFLG